MRVSAAEGDFNIKMPLAAPRAGLPDPDQLQPMKVRMRADANGNFDRPVDNDRSFNGPDRWRQLHNHIAGLVGDGSLAASAEVELDAISGSSTST